MRTHLMVGIAFSVLFSFFTLGHAQSGYETELVRTTQKFSNKEYVWLVVHHGVVVGEFWPVKGLNLVTNQTDSVFFGTEEKLISIYDTVKAVATAPDGMSTGYVGMNTANNYAMEGKALSRGRPCGDGKVHNYAIVIVDSSGYTIRFSHKQEILAQYDNNYDRFYEQAKKEKKTVVFFPSVYRNGAFNDEATNKLDKIMLRRTTQRGNDEQIGVVIFYQKYTYPEIMEIVHGYDRPGIAWVTNVVGLDGERIWGKATKKVNGEIRIVGEGNDAVTTNHLVIY